MKQKGKRNNRRNRTTQPGKHSNTKKKKITNSWEYSKWFEIVIKEKVRIPQKNEKTSWNLTMPHKSHQRNTPLGCPSCKVLWTILEMDKGGSQIDGPNNKKINDDAQNKYSFVFYIKIRMSNKKRF